MDLEIVQIIQEIRLNPPLYFGTHSITRFHAFLDGYLTAKTEENLEKGMLNRKILSGFQRFFQAQVNIPRTPVSWDRMLVSMTGSEQEALDMFWELWDQYLAEHIASDKQPSMTDRF